MTGPSSLLLFESGQEGYHTFRIPAVAALEENVVLAFAEGRKYGVRDDGDIHLVIKRSTDGGRSFGPLQTLAEDQRGCGGNGNGNPTPVWDAHTRTLHFLFRKNFTRVFAMHSKDLGETWSKAKELTKATKHPDMKWFMTGPGHGVQLPSGRLVVGGAHTTDGPWPVYSPDPEYLRSHLLFSDDHGQSWQRGGLCGVCSDECMPVALPDGRLMMSLRNGHPQKRRAFSISRNQGGNFGPMRWAAGLPDPMCQAAILGVHTPTGFFLIHSGPQDEHKRRNLCLMASADLGKTWVRVRQVHRGPAAYSDMALLPGGLLGLLYEHGKTRYWESIRWVRYPLTSLLKPLT